MLRNARDHASREEAKDSNPAETSQGRAYDEWSQAAKSAPFCLRGTAPGKSQKPAHSPSRRTPARTLMALPDSHPEKLWGFKARPAVFAISVGVRTWTRTLSLSFSPPSPPTFCFQLDFFAGWSRSHRKPKKIRNPHHSLTPPFSLTKSSSPPPGRASRREFILLHAFRIQDRLHVTNTHVGRWPVVNVDVVAGEVDY